MIASLRRRHRTWMPVLAVVLPALFAAGLLARTSVPVMERTPLGETGEGAASVLVHETTWADPPLVLRLYADPNAPSMREIELRPLAAWKTPDVLVYWHVEAATGDTLPAGAFLLGSVAGTHPQRYRLPDAAASTEGALTLYSLAHQVVVRTGPLGVP